jgi:serine/threonine-protein kinase
VPSLNPEATLPRLGEIIAGKYAIVRVIGDGGMGIVYEATHLRLRRRVALKMLFPHTASSQTVARFDREARAAARLQHRNVAAVLDVDTTPEGLPYLVMELLEGHDLESELQTRGSLPIAEAVGFVLQACDAMVEAHAAGIVHRDLKPSNLFLTVDKAGWILKVVDFGISKLTDDGDVRLTTTEVSVGTPLYMSPEHVRSARNVDERTDIWSLGVILYELITGRPPFVGSATAVAAAIVADPTPTIDAFRSDVPDELQAAIYTALAKNPAERFPNVIEFARAIAPYGAATPAAPWHGEAPRASLPSALPAYARASEASATIAGPSLRPPSSSEAVSAAELPPVVEASGAIALPGAAQSPPIQPVARAIPMRLLAMVGGVLILSLVLLMALRGGSEKPRPEAPAPVATGSQAPAPAAPAPLAAAEAAPVAPGASPALPAPESRPSPAPPVSKGPAGPTPANRARQPASTPPAAGPPPRAAPASPAPQGQSNPLFL